jgi:hypothetical protein
VLVLGIAHVIVCGSSAQLFVDLPYFECVRISLVQLAFA